MFSYLRDLFNKPPMFRTLWDELVMSAVAFVAILFVGLVIFLVGSWHDNRSNRA